MNKIQKNLEEQLQRIKAEYKDEIIKNTYWRGLMIGLETAIEVVKTFSELQESTDNSNSTEQKALHIADVSKRFSFEQQKAVKYVIDEMFAILKGEYGLKINDVFIDRAFEEVSENVFS